MLYKNAGFTVIATFVLALGIGGAAAIFSIVDAVVLRPLPYPEPERLVWVWTLDGHRNNVAAANFMDWRDQNSVSDRICATAAQRFSSSRAATNRSNSQAPVSPPISLISRAQHPSSGRTFLPEDEEPGREMVVVSSYGVWQRRFGSVSRFRRRRHHTQRRDLAPSSGSCRRASNSVPDVIRCGPPSLSIEPLPFAIFTT